MAADRTRALLLAFAAAAGGATFVAVPWWPRTRANPLPERFDARTPGFAELQAALQRHDDACQRGDVAAFGATVTAAHLAAMQHALHQLGRRLDGAALCEYAGNPAAALRPLLDRSPVAGTTAGDRTLVVVAPAADAARGRTAAQELAFAWVGSRFLVDGCRPASGR